jgi:predicted aspartyl protease
MRYAFTTRYGRRMPALRTKVAVLSFSTAEAEPVAKEYTAIWDTGATNSVISKKIVEELNLKPINKVKIHHASGMSVANVYLINIGLPSKVMIGNLEVSDADLSDQIGIPDEDQMRVLIGMDIIGTGDLAVTNADDKTTLSFRFPSLREIDFVEEAQKK